MVPWAGYGAMSTDGQDTGRPILLHNVIMAECRACCRVILCYLLLSLTDNILLLGYVMLPQCYLGQYYAIMGDADVLCYCSVIHVPKCYSLMLWLVANQRHMHDACNLTKCGWHSGTRSGLQWCGPWSHGQSVDSCNIDHQLYLSSSSYPYQAVAGSFSHRKELPEWLWNCGLPTRIGRILGLEGKKINVVELAAFKIDCINSQGKVHLSKWGV